MKIRTRSGLFIAIGAAAVLLFLVSCAAVAKVSDIANSNLTRAAFTTGKGVMKAVEEITPEQEYYLGRAVGASITHSYGVLENEAATRYVNVVGQILAQASDKPETYGGYHYLILQSEDINAFAAPGGLIFISRGMLRLCENEDDLAAVLAHEVAHVNLSHAVSAISNSRWTQVATTVGTESVKNIAGDQVASLTMAFEGSIQDITGTLVTSGYGRGQEKDADELALIIMRRVGYDPAALGRVLARMETQLKPDGLDFAKTHPPPKVRLAEIEKLTKEDLPQSLVAARQARFDRAMKGL
jgi:predicted Zn-dependent protease